MYVVDLDLCNKVKFERKNNPEKWKKKETSEPK